MIKFVVHLVSIKKHNKAFANQHYVSELLTKRSWHKNHLKRDIGMQNFEHQGFGASTIKVSTFTKEEFIAHR